MASITGAVPISAENLRAALGKRAGGRLLADALAALAGGEN